MLPTDISTGLLDGSAIWYEVDRRLRGLQSATHFFGRQACERSYSQVGRKSFCHSFLYQKTMTEVRTSQTGGHGLFATRDYAVGEMIITNEEPLLKPIDVDGKPSAGSTTESSSLSPKQQGMLRIVDSLDALPDEKERTETLDKLIKLYHPNVKDVSKNNKAEQELIKESQHVLEHWLSKNNNSKSRSEEEQHKYQQLMLVWACNSFEGGYIYQQISRVNHSQKPNAQIVPNSHQQSLQAITAIPAGAELFISYLGHWLYTDHPTRQAHLRRDKYFTCAGESGGHDPAGAIPSTIKHPRSTGGVLLEEDVQYDDEQQVFYMEPVLLDASDSDMVPTKYHCPASNTTIDLSSDPTYAQLLRTMSSVTHTVHTVIESTLARMDSNSDNDDPTSALALLEEQLKLASSIFGARHWTTNLLLLLYTERSVALWHDELLANSEDANAEPDLDTLAEHCDALERLVRYVSKQELSLRPLLAPLAIAIARALISLGDTSSKAYAIQWLDQIIPEEEEALLENDTTRTIVRALRRQPKMDDGAPEAKRAKTH